jgi:hypothetical protein
MKRASVLTAAVLFALVACSDRQPLDTSPGSPVFEISDGHNGGNSGFFFLFPIRRLTDDLHVPRTGFNPDLSPVIEVWECSGTSATGCVLPLTVRKSRITMTSGDAVLNRLFVLPHFKEYVALWDTRSLGLRSDRTYRIQVSVGGAQLGFADVDVVKTIKEAVRVDRDDFVPLLQNLILPIRFWVGTDVLCNVSGTPCVSETIELAEGGHIELLGGGEDFRLDIPAGTTATWNGTQVTNVTLNLEVCSGIDVDLVKSGACLRVTSFFDAPGEGELQFSQPLLFSMCVLNEEVHTPDETRQEELITLHQQDGTLIRALPHAEPNCDQLGLGLWDRVKNYAARVLTPKPAHAARRSMALVLDGGAGGETSVLGAKCQPRGGQSPLVPGIMMAEACPPSSPLRRAGPERASTATITPPHTVSDFQFALPAMMDFVNPDDAQRSAPAGTALPTAVQVTDWDGEAVQGAVITFIEPAIEGPGVVVGTATSNSDGVAEILWTIRAGPNTVFATGRGVAGPNNYPGAQVRPFSPDISLPTEQQTAVPLGNGRITFFATGVTEGFTPQTVLTDLEYPLGLWISHFDVTLTETAGHNTAFGGKNTLLRWTPDGGILQTLLTNPVNSDAVVVTEDGSVYLAGYVGSSPGEQGRVSRAILTPGAGWVETHVTDVEIAAQDMFLEANEDIYLIGPSDSPEATNLYRLPSGSYDSPVSLVTGFGRTWSLTKIGSTIYFSLISSGEVWTFSDLGFSLLLTNSSPVTSLTSDGTFLYYGDLGGTIRRRNLDTGADEFVTSGPGQINAVRYDPLSGRLYYLRSGTADAEYKNGTLNYVTVNLQIP